MRSYVVPFSALLFLIFSALFFKSCKSNDDDAVTNVNANVVSDLPEGTWRISYFFNNNADHTNDYSSFTFNFKTDRSVDAVNDIFSETGNWEYEDASNDASDDDGIENDEELLLTFTGATLLGELSDNWHITSASATRVELFDESTNGSMQFLTFSKL
ncbi:hypothetical protein [Altibacter lentus]|uniref:hypothetical protein n=1 Tax=Altibacter lentus TaxID=1223410 RepID=UPI00054DABF0|nr:hypothetical protein [Altibacter lentus]